MLWVFVTKFKTFVTFDHQKKKEKMKYKTSKYFLFIQKWIMFIMFSKYFNVFIIQFVYKIVMNLISSLANDDEVKQEWEQSLRMNTNAFNTFTKNVYWWFLNWKCNNINDFIWRCQYVYHALLHHYYYFDRYN